MNRNISFQILQGLSFIHKHGRCNVVVLFCAIHLQTNVQILQDSLNSWTVNNWNAQYCAQWKLTINQTSLSESCSLWTKYFFLLLACLSLMVVWILHGKKQQTNHTSSVKLAHLLFTQIDSQLAFFCLTGSTHAFTYPEQMHFSGFLFVQFRVSPLLFPVFSVPLLCG